MNTKQLKSFLIVAQEGSITKASALLHFSVPSIKGQIDSLEEELQVKLVFRSKQGITLTEEGAEFLPFVKKMLRSLDNEIEKIRQMSQEKLNTIKIGYNTAHLGDTIYYDAFSAFQKQYPQIQVELIPAVTFEPENHDLFLGTITNCSKFFKKHSIGQLPLYCVLPASHRFSNRSSITLSDLRGLSILLPPQNLTLQIPGFIEDASALFDEPLSFLSESLPMEYTIQRAILQKQCSIILGHFEDPHAPISQILLEGYVFDYYIYSYDTIVRPCITAYVTFMQQYYSRTTS